MIELNALDYDPFEGDFGSPGDRTLKDKIGIARKSGECHHCSELIMSGEKVRMRTDINDGQIMSFRWCQKCCEAMEKYWDDGGKSIDGRCNLELDDDVDI